LRMAADRVGMDLLISSLFAPKGIQGVVKFKGKDLVLPIQAKADQPWFVWGTLWARDAYLHSTIVQIQSEVEYPVIVDDLRFCVQGTEHVVHLETLLRPRSVIRCRLHQSAQEIEWRSVKVTKRRCRMLPPSAYQSMGSQELDNPGLGSRGGTLA